MRTSADERRPGGRAKQEIPDYSRVVEAAQLYYTYGLTRGAIAERFHVQTRTVTEWLSAAVEHGIVTITVHADKDEELDLEIRLREKYPQLERAIIVNRKLYEKTKADDLTHRLGVAVAAYIDELYKASAGRPPLHLAVSGNAVMLEGAVALPNINRENLCVHAVALLPHARLPEDIDYTPIDPSVVSTIIWSRSGRVKRRLELATVSAYNSKAPGPAALKEVQTELGKLEKNDMVREVVETMNDIDVVIGGLGVPTDPYTMEGCLWNIITPKDLQAKGVRGDFCHCTFDAQGNRIDDLKLFITPGHFSGRLWGVNFFKDMVAKKSGKKVVGVALPHHLPALDIALKARIINVVATDTETAGKLLGDK